MQKMRVFSKPMPKAPEAEMLHWKTIEGVRGHDRTRRGVLPARHASAHTRCTRYTARSSWSTSPRLWNERLWNERQWLPWTSAVSRCERMYRLVYVESGRCAHRTGSAALAGTYVHGFSDLSKRTVTDPFSAVIPYKNSLVYLYPCPGLSRVQELERYPLILI